MSSAPVVDLLTSAQKNTWLQATTKIYNIAWIDSAILNRSDRLPSPQSNAQGGSGTRVRQPYVLFATITDPQAEDIDSLEPYGKAIVDYATKNEPDTIFYADGRPIDMNTGKVSDNLSGDKDAFICAVEVYASKAVAGAHLQDDSVKQLAAQGHKLGSKFDIQPMIVQAGWLTRG